MNVAARAAGPFLLSVSVLASHAVEAEPELFADTDAGGKLLVMLQSKDLAGLEIDLTAAGAEITHRLPIIDAIGARMSEAQLETVLQRNDSISRVIDDLAWEPSPELGSSDECPLKSAIELDWEGSNTSWTLFNKSDHPIHLAQGELQWPTRLGKLTGVAMATSSATTLSHAPGEAVDWLAGKTLTIDARATTAVTFSFEHAPTSAAEIQSDMQLSAALDDDCATELVPSYRFPLADSYYPSVSGAAVLHSHGFTGHGITVAILDSGLWEAPPSLRKNTRGEDRIRARFDATTGTEVNEARDESGHGTHMLSVLGRSDATTRSDAPSPSYRGTAPDADIVVVKAFGESGEAGFLDIVRGIQWVVEHAEALNIRVLNLSFAARPRWPYWDDPVNQALMRAWQHGLFIVAAAGNEGPDPMTVGSPGNLPYLLTVGAVTDSWTDTSRDDDYIPDFSSRGPTPLGHIKPDVVALGGHMTGIVPPGSTLSKDLPEYLLASGEFVMTGTSQAAALVSGLAALMLQIDPQTTNDELKCLLVSSAEPAIASDGRLEYSPFVQGSGLVSVRRALTIGERSCDQNNLDLAADLDGSQRFEGPAVFSSSAAPTLPDQQLLINDANSEKGLSASRRWGAEEHLKRLAAPPQNSPIDWVSIYAREQKRLKSLAISTP
ncbi:MAG: S8 family peptidase [Pseudomonadota bacterium]